MPTFNLTEPLQLISRKLAGWAEGAIAMLPNLCVAILVFTVFFLSAGLFRRLARAAIEKTTGNQVIAGLGSTISWLAYLAFGMFTGLEIIGLEKAVTSLLAGLGIVGIALGFAFQDIATNFMAGILIALQRPYRVGDVVKVSDFQGEVTMIELRTTRIRTFDGLEVIIPNKDLFTNALINYTTTPDRRIDLEVGVSYGEDLARVEEITLAALTNLRGISQDRPIKIYYRAFGASSIDFVVQLWITYPGDQHFFKAPHDAIMAIKRAYDREGITIPFPIRTLDFGIKGGSPLEASLAASKGKGVPS